MATLYVKFLVKKNNRGWTIKEIRKDGKTGKTG
jgi:hypothetical protein